MNAPRNARYEPRSRATTNVQAHRPDALWRPLERSLPRPT